jgi:MFS transporter, ACS family, solute carrier family 17 (sodium-dependent inorganic phosphate cotransporter), other
MIENDQAVLPPKSHEMWGLIGLFGFSNYLLRTVLGYIAVSMDHETPGGSGDNNRKAIILSTFFVGYASNNVLAGVAASRFGGMTVLHVACAGWSVCAMMIPTVFDMSEGSASSVGLVMLLLGICCAPMFPASQAVLSFFSTPATISLGASLRAAGTHTGSIVATFATPLLLSAVGWRALLQLYGALGLVIVTTSLLFGPAGGNQTQRKKRKNQRSAAPQEESEVDVIADQEAAEELLLEEHASFSAPPSASVSVSALLSQFIDDSAEYKLLSHSSAQSAFCTHMACNLANFTLLSYMPTYFVDVLQLDLADTAPYLAPSRFSMLLGVVLSGYVSKYVLNHQLLSLTQTRRDGACICLVCTALALGVLPLVHSPSGAALCLCCSTFFIGAFEVFLQSTYIDLCADTPQYAGFLCGSGNTLGALPGALGPFFVSQILTRFESWLLVFWVMSLCLLAAAACHNQYGSTNSISLAKKH